MSRRIPPESIAWLRHAAAAGQADAQLLLSLLERVEALEAAVNLRQQDEDSDGGYETGSMWTGHGMRLIPMREPEPIDEPQTLHAIALKMVDTLERFGVLPEILDTLRRAIREPMQQPTPPPAPQPIPVSERLPGEGDCDMEGRLYAFYKDRWFQIDSSCLCEDGFTHWLPHWALPVPQEADR